MSGSKVDFDRFCTVIDSLRSGGAEKLVLTVHRYLVEEFGARPPIVTLYPGGRFEEEARAVGARVESLGDFSQMSALQWVRRFREFVAQERLRVVHGHLFPVSYLLSASTIGVASPPSIVFTEHNVHNRRRDLGLFRAFERMVYSRFSRVICVSDEVQTRLVEWLPAHASRTVVVRNCIDVASLAVPDRRFADWDCVAVGSLTSQKAHHRLVEAVALLRDNGTDLKVAIAGEGPLRTELESQIEHAALTQSVHLLGEVGNIRGLLASARLFVMPSEFEGLPMALLEAMATGLPVVASSVGGLPEVVQHGETGLLVEPGSTRALADAMHYILTHEDIAAVLGRNARFWVETEAGVAKHVEALVEVISDLE